MESTPARPSAELPSARLISSASIYGPRQQVTNSEAADLTSFATMLRTAKREAGMSVARLPS